MFDEEIIDNDLKEVDKVIREYYDMQPLAKATSAKSKK